jgi:hypothetical protein
MEFDDVRQEAYSEFGKDRANDRLSDALGFMWRRGLLTRYPAPKTEKSFARYAYVWDEQEDHKPVEPLPAKQLGKSVGCLITEDSDGVTLEFDKFVIVIKAK